MRRCFTFPQPSTPSSPTHTPSAGGDLTSSATFTLTSLSYAQTVQTLSYREIWATIHRLDPDTSDPDPDPDPDRVPVTPSAVLRPDRASIDEALLTARPSDLTRLVSDYFDNSELTSRLCFSLQLSIDRARLVYAPLHRILGVLPDSPRRLSPEQCDCVFDALLGFDRSDNPFDSLPAQFHEIRQFFADLRPQLQSLLDKARRKGVLIRHVTHGSAACLICLVVGLAVAVSVVATHGMAAIAAGPVAVVLRGPGDLLRKPRKKVEEEVKQLEDAVQGTYVVDYLETIRCLVMALKESVESDKFVVQLGIGQGSDRHAMEEVVRHLRKNQEGLNKKLTELEEHVCICCAAVNRARSHLYGHFHPRPRAGSDR